MKKNYLLLFLLSLIGWSSGAWAKTTDELNNELAASIPTTYNSGQSFTIQTTKYLNGTGVFMVLKPDTQSPVKLYSQVSTYIGLTNANDPSSWKTNDVIADAEQKTNTWNLSSTDERKGWFSWKANKTVAAQEFNNNGGAKIVIKYDAESQKTTIELSTIDGWTDVVNIEGLELNAREISFTQGDPNGKTSSVTFFAAGDSKQVTYKVWNAARAATATQEDLLGEYTVTEITNNPATGIERIRALNYVTINETDAPSQISENTEVINLYTTAELPFEVGHTYALKLNGWYAYIPSNEATNVGQTQTAYNASNHEAYEWLFTGNWYTGFQIYNFNYGKGIGTANGTTPETAPASLGDAAHFEYVKVNDSNWMLKVKDSNPAAYLAYTSYQSSTINFYNSPTHTGSYITLEEINLNNYNVHISVPEGYQKTGLTATIAGQAYQDNASFVYAGTLTPANVTASQGDLLQTPVVEIEGQNINITYTEIPYLSTSETTVYVRINNLYKTQVDFGNTPQYAYSSGNSIYVPGNASIDPLSAIWKLVKAANNSGVYLENIGTGLQFKGFNNAPAAQGTLMHIYPNSNNNRTGYAIRNATSGNTGAWALNGGSGNLNVKYEDTGWASSVWQFEQISEEQVAEMMADYYLAIVEQAKDQKNGADTRKPFTPISANFKAAVTALQNDKTNAEKLQALKNAVENPDNYYQLPNGRYFVHNWYNYDKSGTEAGNQNNLTKNESTLTSLNALLGTAGKVAGYWSVWDITRGENGYYTMVNEGNRYIMKPGSVQGDYQTNQNYTDEGKLYYMPNASNTTRYQVGTVPSGAVSELKFTPALSLYNQSFNGVSLEQRKGYVTISGSYNTSGKQNCVMFMDAAEDGKAHATYNGDHYKNNNSGDNIVKSGILENVKEECLWSFFRLDTDEGNEQEVQLFHDATEGSLVGIVGGVITLNNVDGIGSLSNIKKKINDNRIAFADNTVSRETFGARAAKYKEVVDSIETLRTHGVDKQYYQFLSPNKDFFVESMCATRPSLYSRLFIYDDANQSASTDTQYHGWQAKDNNLVNEETNEGVFNSVIVEGSGDGGYGTKFYLKNKNDQYLATTLNSKFVGRTTTLENAAQFTLAMVIPGIYEMKQINNQYFTISGSGEHFGLKGFDQAEISAMFRFVTYNTVNAEAKTPYSNTDFTAPAAAKEGGSADIMPVFTTFSYHLATQIQENKNIVPYYITNVGQATYWMIPGDGDHIRYASQQQAQDKCGEGVTPVECNRVYIDMTPAPFINDKYYMEGNQGYLLVGSNCEHQTGTGKRVTGIDPEDIEMVPGNSWPTAEYNTAIGYEGEGQGSIAGKNLFSPNTSADILITSNNQQRYFALQYTYDKIGNWNHQDVMGEGLGFYHLQVGRKIGKFKAYLDVQRVKDSMVDWKAYNPNGAGAKDDFDYKGGSSSAVKAFVESGDGFGIRILDQDGNVTRIVEVDGKGQAVQNTIYDLQGRRVEKAGKGVYIVGGKKVLFK